MPFPKIKKAPPPKESLVLRAHLTALKTRGFFIWRNNNGAVYDKKFGGYRSSQTLAGVPDIAGILPTGHALYIEIKRPGGKPSQAQKDFIQAATNLGALAFVSDDVLSAIKKIDEFILLKKQNSH